MRQSALAGKCIAVLFVLDEPRESNNEHHHRSAVRLYMNGMFGMRTFACVCISVARLTHTMESVSQIK